MPLRRPCEPPRVVVLFKAKKTPSWRLGTWNTRSLLDAEGPIETARQGRDAVQAEDQRADLVVRGNLGYPGEQLLALV